MMQMKGETIHDGFNPEAEFPCFRCVKITLIVIHSISLVVKAAMADMFIAAFFVLSADKTSDNKTITLDHNNEKVDVDDKALATVMGIVVIVFTVFEVIVLIGIVRENKNIVFVYLVFGVIGIVRNLFVLPMFINIPTIIVVSLTAYFAYMIVKKDRQVV
ncbi:unnamed protein product [Oppiella nova]|uniref:Uncharacterized protein n=1 Tax=Oppiella nova TaxID=334625 RepID=A0A7R9MMX2_9ACAR|nr:unnamed protein product [Oppiella nova]CAG2180044.1 unnamed protein product [Oppiella nova]